MSSYSELTFAVRRYWKSVVAAAIVGALFGLAISMIFPVRSSVSHIATARVYVLTEDGANELQRRLQERELHTARGEILVEIESPANVNITSDAYTKARIPTYLGILGSDATAIAVAEVVGVPQEDVKARASFKQRDETNIVDIEIFAASATSANDLLQAYVTELSARIEALEEGDTGVEVLGVAFVEPAAPLENASQAADAEQLIRQNPDWLETAGFDAQLADSVVAEVSTKQTSVMKPNSSSSYVLEIVTEIIEGPTEGASVEGANELTGNREVWLVQAKAESEGQAVLLVRDAAQSLSLKLDEVVDSKNTNGERTIEGPLSVQTSIPVTLPDRGTTGELVTNIALGIFVGIALGLLYAIIRSNVAPVIRTPHQIARLVDGAPFVVTKDNQTRISAHAKSYSDYLPIAVALDSRQKEKLSFFIAPVSPELRSTDVALGIARALTTIGARVCVLALDTKNPKVVRVIEPAVEGGLSKRDSEREVELAGPTSVIAYQQVMEQLQKDFNYVVVAGEALGASPDGLLLARMTDGVLITARYASTRMRDYAVAVASIEQAKIVMLRTVVTDVPWKESAEWRAYSLGISVARE